MKRPPKDTAQSQRGIGRRTLVVGGLQLATAGLLALKLRSMQVEQAETFRLLADENRINIKLLPPARGLIYDRHGVLLAGNEQNYRITMTREDAGDVEEVLERLSQLIPLSDTARAEALKEMSNRSAFVPVTIADRLTWDDITRVTVNAPALPGVTTEVGLSRYYS